MNFDIGTNMLDGGAPYYQTYETADSKFMTVGAIEGKFYREFLKGLDLDPTALLPTKMRERWPEMTRRFAEIFKAKTKDEWTTNFEGRDAYVSPVLELNEADYQPPQQEERASHRPRW
ncbi:MAG: CoA transferase [Desulfatiglandales bacterium]|jgi:alpha-methylacyl-CoA racemase|nr:CoA transferase [Desulfatiglandales bacterium]